MGALDYDVIARRSDAAYHLSRADLRLARVDEAFDEFCATTGGPESLTVAAVGTPLLDYVPIPLRRFYADLFRIACELGRPVRHDYQCSSLRQRRWYAQYVMPTGEEISVHNVLASSKGREGPGPLDDWSCHENADGCAIQCCHCRRMEDVHTGEWKLFRECYEPGHRAPPIRQVLCPMCDGYFAEGARVASCAAEFLFEDRFSPAAVTLLE